MLQAYGSDGNVVALVPSVVRSRSSVRAADGERGRIILFTGVRRERMDIAQVDRIALAHTPDNAGRDDLSHA